MSARMTGADCRYPAPKTHAPSESHRAAAGRRLAVPESQDTEIAALLSEMASRVSRG